MNDINWHSAEDLATRLLLLRHPGRQIIVETNVTYRLSYSTNVVNNYGSLHLSDSDEKVVRVAFF